MDIYMAIALAELGLYLALILLLLIGSWWAWNLAENRALQTRHEWEAYRQHWLRHEEEDSIELHETSEKFFQLYYPEQS